MKEKRNIIIVGLIIVLIAGIYYVKNKAAGPVVQTQTEATEAASEVTDKAKSEDTQATETEVISREVSEDFQALLDNPVQEEKEAGDFEFYATEEIDLDRLKSYGIPISLTFGSEGCIYCVEMKPYLEALNQELQGKAIVKYVDIDDVPGFSAQWPIQGTPATMLIDKSGAAYSSDTGYDKMIQKFSGGDSEGHDLSMIYGQLKLNQMEDILGELNAK